MEASFPTDTHIVAIGEARDDGFAIAATGRAWAWGYGANGLLRLGSTAIRSGPVEIPGLHDVVAVQGGQGHVPWLLADRTVDACRLNSNGQLGDGKTRTSEVPVLGGVSMISSTAYSVLALWALPT